MGAGSILQRVYVLPVFLRAAGLLHLLFLRFLETCSEWHDTSYCASYPTTGYSPARGSGNGTADLSVTAAVPEPSTWAMIVLGFAGLSVGIR